MVEHYSTIKRNEILTCTITWINLKINTLSEKFEARKIEKSTVLIIGYLRKGSTKLWW